MSLRNTSIELDFDVFSVKPEDLALYQIQALHQALRDKFWRINNLYKIYNKSGMLVTFKLNEEQTELWNRYEDKLARFNEFGLREQILKARQLGITTFHAIYYLDKILFNPGRVAGIIAHLEDDLIKIFEKVSKAFEYFPEYLKPKTLASNKYELKFETGSEIFIALKTRSRTIHHLHVSEIAKITDEMELRAGSFQSVPKWGDITIEGTAEGMNHFYDSWHSYEKGDGEWRNHFFTWTQHPEYATVKSVPPNWKRHEYEAYLNQYHLTKEQKNWWYYKLEELKFNFDNIKQEYPMSAEDAFIGSGSPRFNLIVLRDYKKAFLVDQLRGNLDDNGNIVEDVFGFLRFWEPIKPLGQYLISADVSEGLESGDFSTALVIDLEDGQHVAEWHGHIEYEAFGYELVKMAWHWNNAMLVPETGVSAHGTSAMTQIRQVYNYPDSLIFQSRHLKERSDQNFRDPENRYGWQTNQKMKSIIIDHLASLIAHKTLPRISEPLYNELTKYIKDARGRTNAAHGSFDDRVMALAIGHYTRRFIEPAERKPHDYCKNCVYGQDGNKCGATGRTIEPENWCSEYVTDSSTFDLMRKAKKEIDLTKTYFQTQLR